MTKGHLTIVRFTKPLSETIAGLSRATIQHIEAKTQRARLAHDIESLAAIDPHILKDIGMAGFDRLPPALQECVLLNWSTQDARI